MNRPFMSRVVFMMIGAAVCLGSELPSWNQDLKWTALPLGEGVGNIFQCPVNTVNSISSKESFLVDFGTVRINVPIA